MTTVIKAKWNKVFKPANETRCRYRLLKGSAGSGKSVNVAQDYIIKLSDMRFKGANLLVVRKVDETNRDSTFAELESAIYRLFGEYAPRIWRIRHSPLSMECLLTGNRIIFRGMKDAAQREKVKSITFKNGKLTWIWIEEATELLEEDVDILDDRLRGVLPNPNLYYQITFTFNPVSAAHWIKRKYFDAPGPDIFTHHSTYLDNRFIDAAYHKRMEKRKRDDPEGYRVYGLGKWGETGGLILTNWRIEEVPLDINSYDNVLLAQDFGYNHANAILLVGFKDGVIHVMDELYVYEKTAREIMAMAEAKFPKHLLMWCDSAEPDKIREWQAAGWMAYGVKKGEGSVLAQIDYLKQHEILIHPQCVNTIREAQQWKWVKDEKTGAYLDKPAPFMDDAMAALRYSIEEIRRYGVQV